MLSLKFGRPIAYILDGKKGKRRKFIYIKDKDFSCDKKNDEDDIAEFESKFKIQPLPRMDWVEKIYVSGPSGAGKSTFIGNWLAEYRKMFKQSVFDQTDQKVKKISNPIYILSSVDEDAELDRNNPIRIELNEELLEDPIEPDEFAESCVVFDDTMAISNIHMRKYLQSLMDLMLEISRHHNTRMLITSHLTMNYLATRRILTEMTSLVIYPHAGATRNIRRVLDEYCGLEKHQIKKILSLHSRWVLISLLVPQYVMYEKGCYIITAE